MKRRSNNLWNRSQDVTRDTCVTTTVKQPLPTTFQAHGISGNSTKSDHRKTTKLKDHPTVPVVDDDIVSKCLCDLGKRDAAIETEPQSTSIPKGSSDSWSPLKTSRFCSHPTTTHNNKPRNQETNKPNTRPRST